VVKERAKKRPHWDEWYSEFTAADSSSKPPFPVRRPDLGFATDALHAKEFPLITPFFN
jgi:hypothetical protein